MPNMLNGRSSSAKNQAGGRERGVTVVSRILIIEDDDNSRDILAAILSAAGHQVLLAADGESGLDLFGHRAPQLVIVDIVLPGKSGFDVIRNIRSTSRCVKIIAISAVSETGGAYGAGDVLGHARA